MITNSSQLSEKNIHKIIIENFDEIAPIYYKLLSEWVNSSFNKFQDIEKYLIILYLIQKDFDYYIKNGLVESYDSFFLYDKSLELGRINIIEISRNLNIPKESVRRKILRLEEFGVLKKIRKNIYIDRSAFKLVQSKSTLKNLSTLLSKIVELCKKQNISGFPTTILSIIGFIYHLYQRKIKRQNQRQVNVTREPLSKNSSIHKKESDNNNINIEPQKTVNL